MPDDPVAIITAAGRGMGAACARRLADDGYRVSLLSPSGAAEELAAQLGGLGYTGSVADPVTLQAVVERTMNTFGRVDAVVNNTGHPPKGDLLDIADDDWHAALDLVLLPVVRLCRLVTPLMTDGGAFVNISTFGAREPSLDFPVSSSLRAALSAWTKLFADRYAADGIRMNCVLPGFVDSFPEKPEIVERIPLGRFVHTTEIAATVAYLVSEQASAITGQSIVVDGGLTRSW